MRLKDYFVLKIIVIYDTLTKKIILASDLITVAIYLFKLFATESSC